MKTLIKWLAIFFLIAEIFSAVGICLGILLKSQALTGAVEMLTLGFSLLAFIFLFRSVTPFYKRYVSTSPAVNENLPLVIRRLLYFSIIAAVLWVMKRERKEVLLEPMIRMVCLFIVHLIL